MCFADEKLSRIEASHQSLRLITILATILLTTETNKISANTELNYFSLQIQPENRNKMV